MHGKSREAVTTNAKLDKLLLSVNEAYNFILERKQQFTVEDIKNLFQGSVGTQMTLLKRLTPYTNDLNSRVGVDVAKGTIPNYHYTQRSLVEFIKLRFNASDLAFGQLNEQFIREYQDFCLMDKDLAMDT